MVSVVIFCVVFRDSEEEAKAEQLTVDSDDELYV
jgi:hypothetical protein